jgi:hypothetical protein
MASRWTVQLACTLILALAAVCGVAQEPAQAALPHSTAPQSTTDALHAMSRLAGVIFTGQVIAVRRMDAVTGATGMVEIEFVVEDAIRGVSGNTYTLREWAGLWQASDQPFRVGQRFFMLLHAPGAAGLSSPVGGMDGAIPIRGSLHPQELGSSGFIVASGTASAVTSAPPDISIADLRWVATRVVQPLSPSSSPAVLVSVDTVGSQSASASQGTAYTAVLAMLRGWEESDHATR